MAKLVDFYEHHHRLFLAQKHSNTSQTEKFKDTVALKFFRYCETLQIYHTRGIRKQTAIDFFNSSEISKLSSESRRKHFLVVREIYRRFFKIVLGKIL